MTSERTFLRGDAAHDFLGGAAAAMALLAVFAVGFETAGVLTGGDPVNLLFIALTAFGAAVSTAAFVQHRRED